MFSFLAGRPWFRQESVFSRSYFVISGIHPQQPCKPRALSACRGLEMVVGQILSGCGGPAARSDVADDSRIARKSNLLRIEKFKKPTLAEPVAHIFPHNFVSATQPTMSPPHTTAWAASSLPPTSAVLSIRTFMTPPGGSHMTALPTSARQASLTTQSSASQPLTTTSAGSKPSPAMTIPSPTRARLSTKSSTSIMGGVGLDASTRPTTARSGRTLLASSTCTPTGPKARPDQPDSSARSGPFIPTVGQSAIITAIRSRSSLIR